MNIIEFILNNKEYIEDLITRSTYNSNAIEGSTLTYAETYAKNNSIPYMNSSEEPPSIVKGDINKDKKVTATDLLILKQKLVGLIETSNEDISILDISNDGKIGSTDLLLLKRIVVGL